MRRNLQRLSAKEVANKRYPGYYCDGAGLYLQIGSGGSRSWIFRYKLDGREREMGLGSLRIFSLAEARLKADDARRLLASKIDPIQARNEAQAHKAAQAAKSHTFDQCAAAYIRAHRAGWKNPKHADQWVNTIATYCSPNIGNLPIHEIDAGLVLKVLEPIWSTKRETAGRLRGRMESIFDWARVRGYRDGDNPARWRGHMDQILPSHKRQKRIRHHPALPFDQVPEFLREIQAADGTAARALEFIILTAGRTNEVTGAISDEFDLDARLWTVPAERMKAGHAHRVPLPPRAIELVRQRVKDHPGEFVFPGRLEGKPLSNMAMLELLKRLKRDNITVHGFRSSFRDWAAERTSYPREVCEMALAHTISNEVEAAYRRGDLFDKRRRLMNEWARFCEQPVKGAGGVVSISSARAMST